jgi:hypothetical protein
MDEGLKAYLSLIKMTFEISNKKMKEIEKEVQYLDDNIYKVLTGYSDGKIDTFSFIIYMAYLLSGVIDDDDLLKGFIKILTELYNVKKRPIT